MGNIGRGELFEAIEYLALLRKRILGPLVLAEVNEPPISLRNIEAKAPALSHTLTATLASHNALDCLRALQSTAEIYIELRAGGVSIHHDAQDSALQALRELRHQFTSET